MTMMVMRANNGCNDLGFVVCEFTKKKDEFMGEGLVFNKTQLLMSIYESLKLIKLFI